MCGVKTSPACDANRCEQIVNSPTTTMPGLEAKERTERYFRTMLTRILAADVKLAELPEGTRHLGRGQEWGDAEWYWKKVC